MCNGSFSRLIIKVMRKELVSVRLVIQSHLSDSTTEVFTNPTQARERIQFVKYLVHMFPNTDVEIDITEVFKQFKLGNR